MRETDIDRVREVVEKLQSVPTHKPGWGQELTEEQEDAHNAVMNNALDWLQGLLAEQNWLNVAEQIAKERYDGHFTLMRFTTNWRFCFGTVELDRSGIQKMESGKTLVDAVMKAVISENNGRETTE